MGGAQDDDGGDYASLFKLPGDVTYLNGASRSPLPTCVHRVGVQALSEKLTPWSIGDSFDQLRKSPYETETCQDVADLARHRFAQVMKRDDELCRQSDVAIAPSTSFAMSAAAKAFRNAGKKPSVVFVLEDQMSSNVLPWQDLACETDATMCVVRHPKDGDWTAAVVDAVTSRASNSNAVAALPHCHWVDGAKLNLATISKACDDCGCALALDLTQSLGAMPLDVDGPLRRVDFACASTHKWLCGPYGASLMWVGATAPALLPLVHDEHHLLTKGGDDSAIAPFDAIEFGGYDRSALKTAGARQLDGGGRPNPVILPMVAEGLRFLLEDLGGPQKVAQLSETLSANAAKRIFESSSSSLDAGMGTVGGVMTVKERMGLQSSHDWRWRVPSSRAPHILGLRPFLPTTPPHDKKQNGHSTLLTKTDTPRSAWADKTVVDCAAYLKTHHRIHTTGRLGGLRVSFHVYNTAHDVDRLLDGLAAFGGSQAA